VVQFGCHPEQAVFAAVKDLGEPREASRPLRRNNRASGSHLLKLHYYLNSTAKLKSLCASRGSSFVDRRRPLLVTTEA
jgi:hypothetical protein